MESLSNKASDPVERLKAAFHRDDAEMVAGVLSHHPELRGMLNDPLLSFDSPAIMWARSRRMLDVLLDAGADINARSRWWAGGFGILDTAQPDLAAYAIERGAVVDIHAASRLGMLQRVKELIEADPGLVHARGGDGQTPLHFAGTIEIARYLLDHGAQIDARDVDHESTAAQYMVRDRPAIATFLVGSGAKSDILMAAALGAFTLVRHHLDADPASIGMSVSEKYFPKQDPRSGGTIYLWTLGANKTPHLIAREFGREDVFRLLMERTPPELKLAQACELGDEETFKALLAGRPDLVHALSEEDRRKLVNAAENNNARAVGLMLGAGWPVDTRGRHGGTALHWACFHGNAEMVKDILSYNPPLEDAGNEFHGTPLGWGIYGSEHGSNCRTGNYVTMVELLCSAGAQLPADVSGTEAVKEILRRYKRALS